MSTVKICSFLSKAPLQRVEEIKSNTQLSSFQKSTLKRLKARENMIIKKKIDSFHYDTKHFVTTPLKFGFSSLENSTLSEWL